MSKSVSTPQVVRADPALAPELIIPDNNFIVDLRCWIDGNRNGTSGRLAASFDAIFSARPQAPITVSLWPALGENAWSKIGAGGTEEPNLDQRLHSAAIEAHVLQHAFNELFHKSGSRARWLAGDPPGWVREARRTIVEPLPQHIETIQKGNGAWLARSATGLLAFATMEPINKGADEAFRVKLYSRYLDQAAHWAGGIGPMESMFALFSLFVRRNQDRAVGGADPSTVVKVKRPWASPESVMKAALNAARDLAIIRFAHDAMMGCGGFTGLGRRPSAVLTSDKPLQAFADWMPPPAGARRGVIFYDMSAVLDRLPVQEETRRALRDTTLATEAGAVARIAGRGTDHEDSGSAYAALRSLATHLAKPA